MSKQEDQCSETIKQIIKEVLDSGVGSCKQSKSVTYAFISKRECSLQEAAYHLVLKLWLRKIFLGVHYANSNICEKCNRMMLSKKEISELPEDSTGIYKRNMINHCVKSGQIQSFFGPNTEKYGKEKTPYLDTFHAVNRYLIRSSDANIEGLCYASFIKRYELQAKQNKEFKD